MSMINPGGMGVLALVLAGSMQAQEVLVPQHNVELPGVTAESSSGGAGGTHDEVTLATILSGSLQYDADAYQVWKDTQFESAGGGNEFSTGSALLGADANRLWQSQPSVNSTQAGSDSPTNLDAIGEAMANPLSYLWLMFTQNDTIWYDGDLADDLGEDSKVQNSYLINPVIPMQLTEKWKLVLRPVIPINSFETVDNVNISTDAPGQVTGVDFERETGIGDIVLWAAFSKQYQPPYIFGFGPTIMLDTATDEALGTGKNSAGPMALAFKITDKWILGTVAQHWWSFSGDDDIKVQTSAGVVRVDRPDVNLTDIQPVIRYRLSPKTNIGMAPNWRYNHETDQLSLPIGGGFDTLVMFGKLPVKIGLEAYYYVEKDDDFGPDWQIRFLFIPVLPSPEWSRRPLF